MISDDERREVAARLRVYSHDFDFDDSNPFWYVSKAAFGDVDVHTYYSVFARLADLIDRPTCRMEEFTIDNGSRSWGMRCTACGKEFEHMKPGFGWLFCPNCGAMVVEEVGCDVREL